MDTDVHRKSLGKNGENLACGFLTQRGHVILERNWRYGHLEIDIITSDRYGIHFVEVKTRQHNVQAPPQDNVNPAKQRRIVRAAQHYLKVSDKISSGNDECFFDIVAITIKEKDANIEWIPQAFIPLFV